MSLPPRSHAPRLVIATRNAHKTAEIRDVLGEDFEVLDATAFLENARLKALGISRCLQGWVLSDDSGLEVDALDGAPGVYSSSYGGEEGNHALNNQRLMREMKGKSPRTARFRCTMVLARDGREEAHFSGTVEGHLIGEMRDSQGFGYDPLFIPDGHKKTFAELGPEIKSGLSHRARALRQAVDFLTQRG